MRALLCVYMSHPYLDICVHPSIFVYVCTFMPEIRLHICDFICVHIYTWYVCKYVSMQVDGQSRIKGNGQKFVPEYSAYRNYGNNSDCHLVMVIGPFAA